ncbi:MAG: flagellar brake protein [Lachnospiraceae bacterium]|nr:flagellar brake protein [Lachnospiraceae bacterium]MBO6298033.1 flagellar brake protein [Lachnospiraceae bacterium]MBP3297372.1 flagellar brake protein [Lachnospiraceae bacterium]MCR5129750.1 PilZ domain-containing protein [Lachnospiraceae bacterium]
MEKILKPGIPMELLSRKYKFDSEEAKEYKMASSVSDVIDDTHIEITNPVIKARSIPVHSGERYNAYFFGSKIYTAPLTIVRNRTEGNIRVVVAELTGSLQKFERRQYYRLECSIDVRFLVLTAENAKEFQAAVKEGRLLTMPGFEMGTTIDISGGGIRFTSRTDIPKDSMVITHMVATVPTGEKKNYVFLGKIIETSLMNGQRGRFDHRMKFVDMKQEARDEFVRFIFEWERDRLKKMSGLKN